MSVAFHPDPASVIARRARLGYAPSPARSIVFRPAPATPPPALSAAETAGPVAILPADSAPPIPSRLYLEAFRMLAAGEGKTKEQVASIFKPSQARDIMRKIEASFNVSWRDIQSVRRTAPIVWPRQVACWAMHKFTNYSLPDIGRRMGGLDHTTVLHAVRVVEGVALHIEISANAELDEAIAAFSQFATRPKFQLRPPRSASSDAGERG